MGENGATDAARRTLGGAERDGAGGLAGHHAGDAPPVDLPVDMALGPDQHQAGDAPPVDPPVDVALGPDLASLADPRATSRWLRQQGAVVRFGQLALVTPRKGVEEVLHDPVTFSSRAEAVVQLGNHRPLIPLQIDPPKHVKYRRILDPLFAPRQVAKLEPEVTSLVGSLIDRFAGKGSCDFHEEFAVPLPCKVFLDLVGLPMEDLDLFLDLKEGIIRAPGATPEEQEAARQAAASRIYSYFDAVVSERSGRWAEYPDLLSRIASSHVDGEPLTSEELVDIAFLFLLAGLDTITDSLDCFFAYLAEHPEQRQQMVDDPSIIPSGIEELLRYESPVPAVVRVATRDTEIGGCPVQAGEQVMALIGSANTDEAVQPDAGMVDLRRNPNAHLAFGGGVHRCLGSHLARLELRVALREFHKRIPSYSLAPGTVLEYTPGLRSVKSLPLVFQPAGVLTG